MSRIITSFVKSSGDPIADAVVDIFYCLGCSPLTRETVYNNLSWPDNMIDDALRQNRSYLEAEGINVS